eukprot:CAMPEP_0119030490 /NCGR_PEP_ID=MMETSP1176-20130426/41057_1 /TAXON_ID=265551 /ORGANISM="Synedropsis recta cf, Strain CCMP1620" /LENGTH=129 /DNA_ID=CAMNT_0006986861 /DNA_START=58 /DNA_END=447 /DNA_ORIENTATION=-
MADRLFALFPFLGQRSASRTMNNPNSWATVSLWRRFFQMQEQRELEFEEALEELVNQAHTAETMRPIDSEYSVGLRRQATREAYRDAMQFSAVSSSATTSSSRRTEQERMARPNLEIPVGDNAALYLPQ